jgi:CRISPR-associated endonuclease/helicase Cas3
MPEEIEALVEAVYGESTTGNSGGWTAALGEAKARMEHDRNESEKAAGRLLVCQPKCPCDLIEEFNSQLADDEDPQVHKTIRAATREGDPSITVVMLPGDTVLTPDPDILEVQALLDRSAKLSHRGIFQSLRDKDKSPNEWAKNAHLRHARLLRLNGRNRGTVWDYLLTVDEKLGVTIEKCGGNNG